MAGHTNHVVPLRVYIGVFLALMALTAVTVWAAGQDFGALNTVVALTIAVTKATLVVLFFMHVKYGSPLVKLAVVGAVVWLGFLLIITMSDYASRGWLGDGGGQTFKLEDR